MEEYQCLQSQYFTSYTSPTINHNICYEKSCFHRNGYTNDPWYVICRFMEVGFKLLQSRSCNDAPQKYIEEQEYIIFRCRSALQR
uniref:Uncharacterized protein n=1 Tax=Arundo donax TaxID=35708 RepID=A0A0A9E9N5_ARUDO